jgi:hypothetical protein
LMPVHWGKFTLSLHPWKEPVRRVVAAWAEAVAGGKELRLATPMVGEPVKLGGDYPEAPWWEKVE